MAHDLVEIKVTTLSDDPLILDIFRFKLWSRDEGIDYLLGIFKFVKLSDGSEELQTLDGHRYNSRKDQAIMDDLFAKHDRLVEIWSHSTKRSQYSPSFFIRWGLQHRDICPLAWLEEAQAKGLLPKTREQEKVTELHHSERAKLLQIIAGLTLVAYSSLRHGLKTEIRHDLEKQGFKISENTLNKHLEHAWSGFLPESKPH